MMVKGCLAPYILCEGERVLGWTKGLFASDPGCLVFHVGIEAFVLVLPSILECWNVGILVVLEASCSR